MTLGSNFANGKGNATVFFELAAARRGAAERPAISARARSVRRQRRPISAAAPRPAIRAGSPTSSTRPTTSRSPNAAGNVRPYVGCNGPVQLRAVQLLPAARHALPRSTRSRTTTRCRTCGCTPSSTSWTTTRRADRAERHVLWQPFTLHNENPLLSPVVQGRVRHYRRAIRQPTLYIGRRNIEGGGRQRPTSRHTAITGIVDRREGQRLRRQVGLQRLVAVRQGHLRTRHYLNDFSVARLQNALRRRHGSRRPASRRAASCVDGTDPNCVPYDIFHIGGVTQAALNYLQTPGIQNGTTNAERRRHQRRRPIWARAYGWTLPWARNGIGVAFGIERRVEKLNVSHRRQFDTGDLAGQGGPTHRRRAASTRWSSRTPKSACRSWSGSPGRTTSA